MCLNHNVDGGADDTGGEPNYWWRQYDGVAVPPGVPDCPFVEEEDEDNMFTCHIPNCDPNSMSCYAIRSHNDAPQNHEYIPALVTCVGANIQPVPEVHWYDDWSLGNYPDGIPSGNDYIRERCSEICADKDTILGQDMLPNQCDDENWSGVLTEDNWQRDDGRNCLVALGLNEDDPDGSDFPWDLVGGPTSPVPLDCDLNADCVDWFRPNVAAAVLTPGQATFIEPETRYAHYLAVENGSNLFLEMDPFEEGQGAHDTEALYGLAEYTSIECGDAVCPFYLANLSAYNTVDSWELAIDAGMNRPLNKSISDVQIDLIQSPSGCSIWALGRSCLHPAPFASGFRSRSRMMAKAIPSETGLTRLS